MTAGASKRRFDLRRFLLSGEGWPYLLVPFIPIPIALDVRAQLLFQSSIRSPACVKAHIDAQIGERGEQPFQVTLTDLAPGVVYHYQAVASNVFGVTVGADVTATTLPRPAARK